MTKPKEPAFSYVKWLADDRKRDKKKKWHSLKLGKNKSK